MLFLEQKILFIQGSGIPIIEHELSILHSFSLLCFNLVFCTFRRIKERKCDGIFKEISHFVLEKNDLEVLILSDLNTYGNSIVSLNLNLTPLGEEIPGLFHLFEHVIFEVADEKDGETFTNFISPRSGAYQGITREQGICLFFSIDSIFLEEALERFANLFLLQKFLGENNGERYLKETEAIEKEYQKKIKDGTFKLIAMSRLLQDPPLSNFFFGNEQTLDSVSRERLLDALKSLYENKVSSHLMKLTIFTGGPIHRIEECVSEFFSRIPIRNETPEFHWPLEYKSNQLIVFGPDKSYHQILISLPIPIDSSFPHHLRIFDYLVYLLNFKTEGSWLRHFSGQIFTADSTIDFDILGHHARLDIALFTPSDPIILKDPIIITLRNYLEYLKEHGANKDLYDEFKSSIKMKATNERLGINFLDRISQQMQHNRLIVDWLLFDNMEFDAEIISECLSKIDPQKLNVTIACGQDEHEPQFQIPFSKTSLDVDTSTNDISFVPKLPPKNEFSYSEKFYYEPLPQVVKEYNLPLELVPGLWFKDDFVVSSPELAIKIRFMANPKTSLTQCFMISLFFKLIYEEIFYDIDRAEQAGMKIEIGHSDFCSFNISIYGFGYQIPKKFLEIVLEKANEIHKGGKFDWEKLRPIFRSFKKTQIRLFLSFNSVVENIFSCYLLRGNHFSDVALKEL